VYRSALRAESFAAVVGDLDAPKSVRYFVSDAGMPQLWNCKDGDAGYECDQATVSHDICPEGAPPLLVHTQFMALDWEETKCVVLIPNLYQLEPWQGKDEASNPEWHYAGGTANRAYVAAGENNASWTWENRTDMLLYVGRVTGKMGQRRYFKTLKWLPSSLKGKADTWLKTPKTMPMEEAATYRYLLDIGGSSGTTWDALGWKLASGALVFKAKNAEGAADWWHSKLEPGKHLLEVEPDFSDLHEKFLWAEAHQEEAQQIAKAGQKVALDNMMLEPFVKLLRKKIGQLAVTA